MLRGPFLAVILLSIPLPSVGEPEDGNGLFLIRRSKNRNEVHYDANIEDCSFDDPPVKSYWRDLEEGPDVRSNIRLWEGPAYGFEARRISDTRAEIRLKALPDRLITAELTPRRQECEIVVEIAVQGEPARFRHVYVHATEGFVFPTVDYVDIHGYAKDGRPVVERIVRSERGRDMSGPVPIP